MTDIANSTNPPAGASYKRQARNLLIHKPMQREFTLVLMMLIIVSSLAIGVVIHHTIHSAMYGGGFRFGKVSPYEILSDVSYQLIIRVSCILFVTLLILGVFGLFFMHRVAGPVYRFRQVFIRLNRGEIPNKIRLREGDFFGETAEEFNRLIDRLQVERERDEKIKETITRLAGMNVPDAAGHELRTLKDVLQKTPPFHGRKNG